MARVKDGDVPTVLAHVVEGAVVRKLVVDDCPFCGLIHVHGAGRSGEPIEGQLGEREAGCSRRRASVHGQSPEGPVRRYVVRLAVCEGTE